MAGNLTTTVQAAISRIMGGVCEKIAVDGLVALRKTLKKAEIPEDQYEIFSHSTDDSVIFEIVVSSENVVAADKRTEEALKEWESAKQQEMMSRINKSFRLGNEGPTRVVYDARNSAGDARRGASDARHGAVSGLRDARRGAEDRAIENPRGLDVRGGKFSLTLERSTETDKRGFTLPKETFQGILGDFMKRLNEVILEDFVPELESVISRNA